MTMRWSVFPGVEIRRIEQHRSINPGTHHYLLETEEAILKGQAVLRALDKLVSEDVARAWW